MTANSSSRALRASPLRLGTSSWSLAGELLSFSSTVAEDSDFVESADGGSTLHRLIRCTTFLCCLSGLTVESSAVNLAASPSGRRRSDEEILMRTSERRVVRAGRGCDRIHWWGSIWHTRPHSTQLLDGEIAAAWTRPVAQHNVVCVCQDN